IGIGGDSAPLLPSPITRVRSGCGPVGTGLQTRSGPDRQGWCATGRHCTRRRDNAHKIEEREVLYPWHPWFGRVVHVREVIEKRAGGVLHWSLDGSASARWLELPKWMFDRAACLSTRMEVSPRVDSAALTALKTCLVDASGAG